jgi:CHAT domain-containing protein
VHLATHAEANPEHPNLSRLLLAPATAEDSGLLSAGAIQSLRFPRTRLVYLAACRSGEGRIASEGTLSLARAFLAAGVREVVASLWDIDDSAVGEISQQLYRCLLQGDSADDALRHAQLAAIQSTERSSSLADWASFVVSLGPHGNFVPETVHR